MHRMIRVSAAIAVAAMACVGQRLFAETPAGCINVMDFIAASTNKADHTEAIRAAFAEAGRRQTYAVLFPPGQYTISDTIDISAASEIVGQVATLCQTNPTKGIFAGAKWRITIKGLIFRGGQDQVALGYHNVDQGFVIISECQFFGAGGAAIRVHAQSTHALIEKCAITDCHQALETKCDMTHMRDCWISTSGVTTNPPVATMENYGTFLMEHVLGVPRTTCGSGGANNRWIDNHGCVTCRDVRFGGEGGGFTAVFNYAKFGYPPTYVTLDACNLYNAQQAAVYCVEIPNEINVLHCNGLPDARVLAVSTNINFATYFGENWYVRPRLRIDTMGGHGSGVPETLVPYLDPPITHQGVVTAEGEAAPTVGRWSRGQFLRNRNQDERHILDANGKHITYTKPKKSAREEPYGWYCVESGMPGKWVAVKFVVVDEGPAATAPKN